MLTVSLIGADGAGKTTVCRELVRTLPYPVKYIYMGINLDASEVMLPTTRLWSMVRRRLGKRGDQGGPRDPEAAPDPPKRLAKRIWTRAKSAVWVMQLLTEECFRYGLARWYMARGYIVICDRHFFLDYYHYDIAPMSGQRTLPRRIHGFCLSRLFPRPDQVIFLDAPAELLFRRKREGTLRVLEMRRRQYREFQQVVDAFHVIDASQKLDQVVGQTAELIGHFYRQRQHDARRSRAVVGAPTVPAGPRGVQRTGGQRSRSSRPGQRER